MAGAGSRPFSCLRRLWHDGDSCKTNRPRKGRFEFTRRLPVISNAQVTPVLAAVVTRATAVHRNCLDLLDLGDELTGNHVLCSRSGATLEPMARRERRALTPS